MSETPTYVLPEHVAAKVRELVAAAPPLSVERRDRIAALIGAR